MPYHVAEGTPAKVARTGQTPQDHTVSQALHFADGELVADPLQPPADDSAASRWARRGWYVFQRGNWYLLVEGHHVDIAY